MKENVKMATHEAKEKLSNFGGLSLRGRAFVGTVISSKMQKTVTVEWERKHFLKKFERYERRRSRVKAHNPDTINAQEGDVVKIMECRPLSKTKNFVVIEILGKARGFRERMEALEESKFKKEVKKEEKESKTEEAKKEATA